MAVSEFKLIDRYFAAHRFRRDDVVVGIGDDAAVVRAPVGTDMVMAVDTLVCSVHFPTDTAAAAIGHKALAVNLSDMAAMGASPAWATLAVTLPEQNSDWIDAFCHGLFALADRHGVQLIGGDTTRGPLAVSVNITGLVPQGQALRRSGARPGDLIYVTGVLGEAALGLKIRQGQLTLPEDVSSRAVARLDFPEPRVSEGLAVRDFAHSAIDISDGLAADLGHILHASGVGATVSLERLPLAPAFALCGEMDWSLAVAFGDDYELCFTVAPEDEARVEAAFIGHECGATCIGRIEAQPGLRLRRADGSLLQLDAMGYDHFHL